MSDVTPRVTPWCKYQINSTGTLCGFYEHLHAERAPGHEFQPHRDPPAPPEPRWVPCQREDLNDGDRARILIPGVWRKDVGLVPDAAAPGTYERWTP